MKFAQHKIANHTPTAFIITVVVGIVIWLLTRTYERPRYVESSYQKANGSSVLEL